MLVFAGLKNLSGQILLTNNQFDLLAKTAIVKEAVQDSLRECKVELRECEQMVSNLEIKNTGTEFALAREGQIKDNYRLSLGILQGKYDKKSRLLKFFIKATVVCVGIIVVETVIIYAILTISK